jgi:hypothetical protein
MKPILKALIKPLSKEECRQHMEAAAAVFNECLDEYAADQPEREGLILLTIWLVAYNAGKEGHI